ncbi:MAG: ATP-binding cassette domain-containing protein [Proteobacteria bacterium]|jgi:molybdate transport system ATP-binding protein|nr:ATP-binding cassette domain-containing protein [Pseudomonadota bacterium]
MSFSVDIEKSVGGKARRFTLKVAFSTHAQRTVIYGPSGAGKSMLLQILAGLITPDYGRVSFADERIFDSREGVDVPARARRFGYLFQDYALFPQLSVRQNVAFALSEGWRNPPPQARNAEVSRWLTTFELDAVAHQRPHELSGGQRQRTALARALVNQPRALLLDEPFAALDPELRARMRHEMDQLLNEVGIPMVMITHDPEDLAWFGAASIHLRDGAVSDAPSPALIQHGPRLAVVRAPAE